MVACPKAVRGRQVRDKEAVRHRSEKKRAVEIERKTDELGNIARQLFDYEAGGTESQPDLADTAERWIRDLYQHLSRLVGPLSTRAILDRALQLAKEQHPILDAVQIQPDGSLRGLHSSVAGQPIVAAEGALITLINKILSVLSDLIGPAMVLDQVKAVWPHLPTRR